MSPFAILVVSTGDRAAMLDTFLRSCERRYPTIPVYGVLQGYEDPALWPLRDFIDLPAPVGPHAARMAALDRWDPEAWIVCDDDMTLTTQTRYSEPAHMVAARPDIGLVSCNWRRTRRMVDNVERVEEYKRQAIVFTGGGLVLSRDTANLIRNTLPFDAEYVCDNTEWSLACYLNGKQNARYRGSVAVHNVTAHGGRQAWLMKLAAARPDPAMIAVADSKPFYPHASNNMLSPDDGQLTAEARARHTSARHARYPTALKGIS